MYAKMNLISLSRGKHQKTILKLDSIAVKESIRKQKCLNITLSGFYTALAT